MRFWYGCRHRISLRAPCLAGVAAGLMFAAGVALTGTSRAIASPVESSEAAESGEDTVAQELAGRISLEWQSETPQRWSGRVELHASNPNKPGAGLSDVVNRTPGPALVGGIFETGGQVISWSPPARRVVLPSGEDRWEAVDSRSGGISFRFRGDAADRLRVYRDGNEPSTTPVIDIALGDLATTDSRSLRKHTDATGSIEMLDVNSKDLQAWLGDHQTLFTSGESVPVHLNVSEAELRSRPLYRAAEVKSGGTPRLVLQATVRNASGDRISKQVWPLRSEAGRLKTDAASWTAPEVEGPYRLEFRLLAADDAKSATGDSSDWPASLSRAVRTVIPTIPRLPLPNAFGTYADEARPSVFAMTDGSIAVANRSLFADTVTTASPRPTAGVWVSLGHGHLAEGTSSTQRILRMPAAQWVAAAAGGVTPLRSSAAQSSKLIELKSGQKSSFELPKTRPGRRHRALLRVPKGMATQLAIQPLDVGSPGESPHPLGVGAVILRHGYDDENHGWHVSMIDFWPRSETTRLLATNLSPDRSARFADIEILVDGDDDPASEMPASLVARAGESPRGRLACLQLELHDLFSQFGDLSDPARDWELGYDQVWTATQRLIATMRREGFDGLILTVASDGESLYPTTSWLAPAKWNANAESSVGPVDALELILRLFDRASLKLIPCIRPGAPDLELERQIRADPAVAAALTLSSPLGSQMGAWDFDGPEVTAFGLYDPTHPAVARRLSEMLGELHVRCGAHPSIESLGLLADDRSSLRLPPVELTDPETLEVFRTSLGDTAPSRSGMADYLRQANREPLQRWLGDRSNEAILLGLNAIGDRSLWLLSTDSGLPSHLVGLTSHQRIRTARLHRRSLIEPIFRRVRDEACNASIPIVDGANQSMLMHDLALFRQPITPRSWIGSLDEAARGSADRGAAAGRLCPILDEAEAPLSLTNLLSRSDRLVVASGGGGSNQPGGEVRRRSLHRYSLLPPVRMEDVQPAEAVPQPIRLRQGTHGGDTYLYAINLSRWPVDVDTAFATPVQALPLEHGPVPTAAMELPTADVNAIVDPAAAGRGVDLSKTWRVSLAAGELAAIRVPGDSVAVVKCQIRFAATADQLANIRQCVQDAMALTPSLATPTPIPGLVNLGFEDESPQGIPGWLAAQHPPQSVVIDNSVASEGARSIRLTGQADRPSSVWFVSQVIGTPQSGRLAVALKLRGEPSTDPANQPPIQVRIALEGTVAGTPIRQTQIVTVPRDGQWSELPHRLKITRLPSLPVDSLRLTVDMISDGVVWVDDVVFSDSFLTQAEKTHWDHTVYLAAGGVSRGDYWGVSRLLDSHWSLRLRRPETHSFMAVTSANAAHANVEPSETEGDASGVARTAYSGRAMPDDEVSSASGAVSGSPSIAISVDQQNPAVGVASNPASSGGIDPAATDSNPGILQRVRSWLPF